MNSPDPASWYTALAIQARAEMTPHARIAALLDDAHREILKQQDWMDDCGFKALEAVELAKVMWDNTYAERA